MEIGIEKVLPVHPRQRYNRELPSYTEPIEVGNFSINGNREFCNDDHQKKYIITPSPQVVIDLNKGYEEAIKRDYLKVERLDHILHWIVKNREKIVQHFPSPEPSVKCINADFVCCRGLFSRVATTPYENRNHLMVCATKFKGTIYMYGFPTEQRVERELYNKDQLMSFWGVKFGQYMTANMPNGIPDFDSVLNINSEYCTVLRGELEKNVFLFAAHIDGIDTKNSHNKEIYGKYKTCKIRTPSEKQNRNFCRYNLIHWWAECFLAGIPRIVCGFRDDNGIVQELKDFYTKDIPHKCKEYWLPNVSINFLHSFLECVKNKVTKDDPRVVYQFYWRPNEDVTFQELASPGDMYILPEWYINEVNKWFT